MLMTPITPKVIARPIAAKSRTDDAEIPYQRFCATPHRARRIWIALRAAAAALFTAGSVAFWAIPSMRLCASWSPRSFSVAIADRRSCGEALSLVAKIDAWASFKAATTRGSLSLPSWA
jgi:hypothetical protein